MISKLILHTRKILKFKKKKPKKKKIAKSWYSWYSGILRFQRENLYQYCNLFL